MKKILFSIVAVLMCMAARSQTLYELKYYDIIDDDTYYGLFVFTDEENCTLRCVTEPDKKGNVSGWEYNYYCKYEKQKGSNTLCFIPEPRKKKDDPLIPFFCMAYSTKGEFEPETYVIFQDIYSDDELEDENMKEVDYFREIDIRDKDEKYFQQFYDEDEEMYKQIMDARKQLIGQDDDENSSNNDNSNVSNDDITMHLVLVGATEDNSIGESVTTDVSVVKKNFSEIAQKLGIGYNETIITGADFKKANILNAVDRLKPGSNDIVVFVYSGHGFRYDDDTDAYPRMCITYNSEVGDKYELSTTELYKKVVNKKARLTIFLTDCCNSEIGMTRAMAETVAFSSRGTSNNTDIDKLYDLFIDESGTVRATAAKAGQYAWGDVSGGYMITSIINNIKSQTSALSKDAPSWKTIIENASKVVAKKTSHNIDEAGNDADPQVVVRAVKVQDIHGGKASSLVSSDNESESLSDVNTRSNSSSSENTDSDAVVDFLCIAISVIVILGLIIVIIKLMKKKKQQ